MWKVIKIASDRTTEQLESKCLGPLSRSRTLHHLSFELAFFLHWLVCPPPHCRRDWRPWSLLHFVKAYSNCLPFFLQFKSMFFGASQQMSQQASQPIGCCQKTSAVVLCEDTDEEDSDWAKSVKVISPFWSLALSDSTCLSNKLTFDKLNSSFCVLKI